LGVFFRIVLFDLFLHRKYLFITCVLCRERKNIEVTSSEIEIDKSISKTENFAGLVPQFEKRILPRRSVRDIKKKVNPNEEAQEEVISKKRRKKVISLPSSIESKPTETQSNSICVGKVEDDLKKKACVHKLP